MCDLCDLTGHWATTVWRRATYRTSVADAAHPDHMSMTDNDVMQVAMSGHLLMEPKMSDSHNDIRRVTNVNEPSDAFNQSHEDGLVASRNAPPGRGDSTSSLEHYFDQQFTNFPMSRLSDVDWSLRSDDRHYSTFDVSSEVL